jgi:hypothetical protein
MNSLLEIKLILTYKCQISRFIYGIMTYRSLNAKLSQSNNCAFGVKTKRWRSWLRHCATNRKVAESIPNCAIGIFHWHNPSGRTMALGLPQPLTDMSTRNISWGKRRPLRRADNLTSFMCWLSWNLGASTSWNPQGLSRPVMGLLYHDWSQNYKALHTL